MRCSLALILFGPEWSFLRPDPEELEARQQELRAPAAGAGARGAPLRLRAAAGRHRGAAAAAPRRAVRHRPSGARAVNAAETPTNPLPFSRGDSVERTESAPEESARGAGDGGRLQTRSRRSRSRRSSSRGRCRLPTTGIRRETEASRPAPGPARRRAAQPRALRPEPDVQQPAGRRQRSRVDHPVRHQGRRVRALDPPLRRAGAAATGSSRRRR